MAAPRHGRRASMTYLVPTDMATSFTPGEVSDFRANFSQFDKNGDGTIDVAELAHVLSQLGETVGRDKINSMIAEVDMDGSHTVDFGEFCHVMKNIRDGNHEAAFHAVAQKAAKVFHLQGAGGAQHSFSEEEKIAFTEHVNKCLGDDPVMGPRLPLDPNSMDLFAGCGDGLLLCKLINMAVPDTVDERALNKRDNMNVYQKTENNNLAINAAKAIGCKVVNVGPSDLIEGRPILILGLIWQIIKIQLLSQISLTMHPELVRLLNDGETLEDLMKLPPEQVLLRWFNFHLAAAGHPSRVTNFGADIKDAEAYSVLLHQLNPNVCDYAAEPVVAARAAHVLENAEKLGVPHFIKATDITSGNKKLNLGFVAQLFNTCPGLTITEEELGEYDFAGLELDDAGDTREERVFRMWINSLGDDTIYVNNLFSDVSDGVVILKVMDKVQPGIVNWRKVNMAPRNKFKKVENCNYCVVLGKKLNFSLVGIGGVDIVNQNKMLILAIIWQLMRRHTLNILTKLGGGHAVEEPAVVNWANGKVQASGKSSSIRNFHDHSLSSGRYLIELCGGVEPRAVNWEYVSEGASEEDALNNGKYAISIARRIGACVFLTPEDIYEVKPKMIMMFVASLWITAIKLAQ
mmetsp:Transcript_28458/g.91100  ORF Transcript_28458/g.91100 Transcript_28458/m.91100 type:complete len:631 (-) Transcript_28458:388-2280(-)